MKTHHWIALAAGIVVGYAMASTLAGYQPFKWAATQGNSLAS